MGNTLSIKTLALSIIFALAVPYGLLVPAPQPAHALTVTVLTDITGIIQSILTVVEETLIDIGTYLQYALDYYYYIKTYVLDPLTFIESGKATQALTGGVLSFVAGGTNGTNQSQFITNYLRQQQQTGDSSAGAFFAQIVGQSNSPYAGAITASLSRNYLQDTSLDGYFAKNQDTLPRYLKSGNSEAFLTGNWSEGGVGGWFALTTQSQNNPYTLHSRSQKQLGLLVAGAETVQTKQADWSGGFLSWCGSEVAAEEPADSDQGPEDPGAPCTNEDGTQGSIATPGSTITGYLDKSLSLNADKINQMGDAATQISSIISSITQLASLGQEVIGGPGSTGLAGLTSDSGRRLLDRYAAATSTFLGAGQCSLNKTALENTPTNGSELLARTDKYLSAQKIILKEAQTADTTLRNLINHCDANILLAPGAFGDFDNRERFIARATSIRSDAQFALVNFVEPVFAIARAASTTVDKARQDVADLQALLAAPASGPEDPPTCKDYSLKIREVNGATPTNNDLRDAIYDSSGSGAATSTTPTSLMLLNGVGDVLGTSVDQMKLLTQHAAVNGPLWRACTVPS